MEMVEQVMAELERLKLSPTRHENKITFTNQGTEYMYCVFGMDGYMFFMTYVAEMKDNTIIDVLTAINKVNLSLNFGKLTLQDGVVLASYEFLMTDEAKMEYVILNALSTLLCAREKFFSEIGG